MNKSLLIRLLVVGLLMTPLQASVTPSFVSEAIPTPSSCMFCESYATGAGRPDYAYEGEFLYACSEWPSEGCAGCDFACDGGYWYSDTDLCAYQCGATLPQSVLDDLDEALGSEEGVVVQALMEHHPGKIAFNRERGAVQVFACGEKVVAQYPVTAGLLKQF